MLRQIRKSLVWYAFVAPALILFAIFILYPTLETFQLSFYREVVTKQEFVGALHYLRLLTDQVFVAAILNTAVLGAAFLILVIPLAFAVVLGAVWAGIAGLLKVTRGVSEVISTIMLNAIVAGIIAFLINADQFGVQRGNNIGTRVIEPSGHW